MSIIVLGRSEIENVNEIVIENPPTTHYSSSVLDFIAHSILKLTAKAHVIMAAESDDRDEGGWVKLYCSPIQILCVFLSCVSNYIAFQESLETSTK